MMKHNRIEDSDDVPDPSMIAELELEASFVGGNEIFSQSRAVGGDDSVLDQGAEQTLLDD